MRTALRTPTLEQAAATAALLEQLGRRHDALGITEPVCAQASTFFDRPYPVVWAERFSAALHARITDPRVTALPHDIGSVDTLTDSVLALRDRDFRERLRVWWRGVR